METYSGGVDKLELRVPAGTPFRREFAEMYADLACQPDKDPFRPSKHYLRVGDLRPYSIEAALHAFNKHGNGDHKIELIDTAQHGYSGMMATAEQIFETDPEKLAVMRVDLCTDTPGVPVDWFQQRMRAQYKQFASELGKIEYVQMGKREVQTLYFGKRPNCIRVYDKIAELKAQFDRMTRRKVDPDALAERMREAGATEDEIRWRMDELNVNPDADVSALTFEESFGVPATGFTLTRVERQIAGGRVPEPISTAAQLRKNAADFNPFERLRIVEGKSGVDAAAVFPSVEEWGVIDYLAGCELRRRIEDQGLHHVRNWLNQHSTRNADRILKKFRDFLPSESVKLTVDQLYEQYRASVSKQLAA